MSSLTRYIFFLCLGATVLVAVGLSTAAWLIQALKLVELLVDHGIGVGVFLELVLLSLPQLMTLVLPIAAFVGVQFAYGRLISDSELVVMRACGLSQGGLARPALLLGGIAALISLSLTIYFLPASKNAFKDLQFQVRNQFSSEMLQEGTFNALSGTLTVYIRSRDALGQLKGLVIQDARNPHKPVTLTAESGVILHAGDIPRVLMFKGTRQTWDQDKHQLSVLSFDRWSLDLDEYRDVPGVRNLQPDERFLPGLFAPTDPGIDPEFRERLWVEGHNRLVTPIYCLTFIFISLAAQLTGEINRRGQTKRVLLAWLVVAVLEAGSIGFASLADHHPAGVLLMYANALVPCWISASMIFRRQRAAVPALPPTGVTGVAGA